MESTLYKVRSESNKLDPVKNLSPDHILSLITMPICISVNPSGFYMISRGVYTANEHDATL